MNCLNRVKRFTLAGHTFEVKAGRRKPFKFKCECGSTEFEDIFSISDDLRDYMEYEKWVEFFGSMEAIIFRCKKCGRYYLEREACDYDYFYVNPLVKIN